MKVCTDLSTKEFLRALQLHCFEYGMPELCLSDLGASFVAEANIITDFLKDPDTKTYLEEQGIKSLSFEKYFKGHHLLGGLVEVCVKMVKQLMNCSIKNYVLNFREFEFIVAQTIHLVNQRPIAFQEALRVTGGDTLPDVITPEKLIHGYDLASLNIIPGLQPDPKYDPDWLVSSDIVDNVNDSYKKLKKARNLLIETYNSEFLGHLIKQAVNSKCRYKPVLHKKLQIGDIVLIKEDNCKLLNFPMAIVTDIITNTNNEVTSIILRKGKTRETVKRHVSSLTPILSAPESQPPMSNTQDNHTLESSHQASSDPVNSSDMQGLKKI